MGCVGNPSTSTWDERRSRRRSGLPMVLIGERECEPAPGRLGTEFVRPRRVRFRCHRMAVRTTTAPQTTKGRGWAVALTLLVLVLAALFLRSYWNLDAAQEGGKF